MRLEAPDPALLEPLGGQQQVHSEAAAKPPDGDEDLEELRARGEQLPELVHHDEQVGQSRQVRAVGQQLLVDVDRLDVAGVAQQLLAPVQLAGEGRAHPVDESEVVGEVGD